MTVRVIAPARLHLGLIHVPVEGFTHWSDGRPVRRFGGLGLMIENPAIRVSVSLRDEWKVEGSLAARAEAFARRVVGCVPGLHVIADGPAEHTGLGVGTALGLSVATACLRLLRLEENPTIADLAAQVGRGARSGIGMYGFQSGGFIVDCGRLGDGPPELGERTDFPIEWRIVLIRPRETDHWHGERERGAFRRCRSVDHAQEASQILHSLSVNIAGAVRGRDFHNFVADVADFNLRAGEPFRDDQGGAYAGRAVTAVVETLRGWGYPGTGQSSWGPTVFCFVRDSAEAEALADRARRFFPGDFETQVARPNNRGASRAED